MLWNILLITYTSQASTKLTRYLFRTLRKSINNTSSAVIRDLLPRQHVIFALYINCHK